MWMPMNVDNSILSILKIWGKNLFANSYGCNRLSSSPKWAYNRVQASLGDLGSNHPFVGLLLLNSTLTQG